VHRRTDKEDKLILVDNSNVLLYVSTSSSCKTPSMDCYELAGSKEHPVQLVGEHAKAPVIYIGLLGSKTVYASYSIKPLTHDFHSLELDNQVKGKI
jgi:hypothetical protein